MLAPTISHITAPPRWHCLILPSACTISILFWLFGDTSLTLFSFFKEIIFDEARWWYLSRRHTSHYWRWYIQHCRSLWRHASILMLFILGASSRLMQAQIHTGIGAGFLFSEAFYAASAPVDISSTHASWCQFPFIYWYVKLMTWLFIIYQVSNEFLMGSDDALYFHRHFRLQFPHIASSAFDSANTHKRFTSISTLRCYRLIDVPPIYSHLALLFSYPRILNTFTD